LPKDRWKEEPRKNEKIVNNILNELNRDNYKKLIKILYNEIKPLRNDINHAGYKENDMKAERFAGKLNELIIGVKNCIV
jgi:hypothetical protein